MFLGLSNNLLDKLPFELYQNPAEAKEIIQAIILLKIVVQWTVQQLHQLQKLQYDFQSPSFTYVIQKQNLQEYIQSASR